MQNKKENQMREFVGFYPKISIGFCKNIKNTNVHIAKKVWRQVSANSKIATKGSIIHVGCKMVGKLNFINRKHFAKMRAIGQNLIINSNKTENVCHEQDNITVPNSDLVRRLEALQIKYDCLKLDLQSLLDEKVDLIQERVS